MTRRPHHRTTTTGVALLTAVLALLATGCRHQTQVAYQPAPPGPIYSPDRSTTSNSGTAKPPADSVAAEPAPGFYDDTRSKPVFTETGLASWYGPNYNHHAAADGTTFNQNELTAAHRTLPLGTTVRVTNLSNGKQVLVRITDRGPFGPDRVIDLSKGAAQSIDMVRAGVVRVKLEAYAHSSADPGGKWAVQTGAFATEQAALDLKAALLQRYKGAKVIEFHGPTGYWVRADPARHERTQAEAMLKWIGRPDAQALPYLVRLD